LLSFCLSFLFYFLFLLLLLFLSSLVLFSSCLDISCSLIL
jgi:hypothetical protein